MLYFSRMALLTVEDISRREGSYLSVDHITFSLEQFQKIAIGGETGSGKTSLLKMIAGLQQPESGKIFFEGKPVKGPEEKLMPGHPGIGYLSQHFELRNNYRIEDELDAKNVLGAEAATKIFRICRIEHLLKRMTNQLSGGEKQRVAMARVLISSPRLLLLDEPYSNLDMGHKQVIKQVVHDIASDLGITILMVLHDAPDILSWADTIMVMQDGKIIQAGRPEVIYHQPVNEYCAGLFGLYNLLQPEAAVGIPTSGIPKDKRIFFRPEDVQVTEENTSTINGVLREITYWGSHYTLEVDTGAGMVSVQVSQQQYKTGDIIHLAMARNELWYL
jgi:ABC-type sugar transport system ATPase subunit